MNRRHFLILPFVLSLSGTALAQAPAPLSFSVREAHEGVKKGSLVLVDIRTPEEWADSGVPEGAVRLDMTGAAFEPRLSALKMENPGKTIALICRTGNRSGVLRGKLAAAGWTNIANVRGGMLGNPGDQGWLAEKLPVTPYK